MMNNRDRQKANINIKMEANLLRMKLKLCAERTCRMAFAFSMIAATFKFLVLVLAGDLMAVGLAGATGFKLKV